MLVMVLADQPLRSSWVTVRPSSSAQVLEVLVVVAALAGGVLDAAGVGQGVGGFVQESAEDLSRAAAQSFAADHDLGALFACDVPAAGGVVTEPGLLAVGSAGDDDDGRGYFRVPAADFQPGVFQDLQDPAGGLRAVAVRGAVAGRVFRLPELVYPDDRTARGARTGAGAVEPVVAAAPVGVGEGVVGFGDLPEPVSGVGAVVHVRVVLLGQRAVGLLDLLRGGVGMDAEQRVVVLVPGFHGTAPLSGWSRDLMQARTMRLLPRFGTGSHHRPGTVVVAGGMTRIRVPASITDERNWIIGRMARARHCGEGA